MGSYPVLLELRTPLEPQELQDHIERELRSKFEMVPRGMELIEKICLHGDIDGVTTYVIYFTKLAIAELFIHFVVTTGKKERMFENRDIPDFHNAMFASTTLVYVEGGNVSDVESHVQAMLEDAAHRQCSSSLFNWTRRCSNNFWFMELVTEELADLLVYRCNKQRQSLFLFRSMGPVVVTEVKPVTLPSPTVRKPTDPRRALLASQAQAEHKVQLSPQGVLNSDNLQLVLRSGTMVEVSEVPVQVEPPPRPSRGSRTSLVFLVQTRTPKVEDMLLRATNTIGADIQPVVEWNADDKGGHVHMDSEVEADRLMDVFLERTMEFFNDPPMRLFRNGSRPGKRSKHDWGDEAEIIIKGFPRGIHPLPAKAAVVELLGRAIGGTSTTVRRFAFSNGTAYVRLRYSSTVEDVLEHQSELVLCGRTLMVERDRRDFPRENRLRTKSKEDREDNWGWKRRRSRSNSRDRGMYDDAWRSPRNRSRHYHGSSSREPERQREGFSSRPREFDRRFPSERV